MLFIPRAIVFLFASLLLVGQAHAAMQFKIATISPDGSYWMQKMRTAADEIEKKTDKRVGFIFLANMQIGYFTPPVGVNLFIASYRFNKSISELYHATIPFMFVLIGAVLLIT